MTDLAKGRLQALLLCTILFFGAGVLAQTGTDYMKGYNLVGRLTLRSPVSALEDTLFLFNSRTIDGHYVIKIRRNSVDSRFMNKESLLYGWIEIPIPIPLFPKVIKKHSIQYIESDADWDYFSFSLDN